MDKGQLRFYIVECPRCKREQEVRVRRTEVGWYFSAYCENCHARINQSNARLIAV